MAYADKEEYTSAIENYTKSIALDEQYWYAFSNRGMALWAIGDRDSAIKDYETAKKLLTGS